MPLSSIVQEMNENELTSSDPFASRRYSSPEMRKTWTEENKLQKFLDAEAALSQAEAKAHLILQEEADEIKKKALIENVKLSRVNQIDREIDHDVMARAEALAEVCEGEAGKYVHLAATSYDIQDPAMALLIGDSTDLVVTKGGRVIGVFAYFADRYMENLAVGRTHGQHAGPDTIGRYFARLGSRLDTRLERIKREKEAFMVGKLRGIVGNRASYVDATLYKIAENPANPSEEERKRAIEIARQIELDYLRELGLSPTKLVLDQVVPREIYADLLDELRKYAEVMDKFAVDVRTKQRPEINELQEPFRGAQVGSSANPSKRNPRHSENTGGLSMIVSRLVDGIHFFIPLWDERDLTNSAYERITLPIIFQTLDQININAYRVASGLIVNPEQYRKNLELLHGMALSERFTTWLTLRGMPRVEAHKLLNYLTSEAARTGRPYDDVLRGNPNVTQYLTKDETDFLLNPATYIGDAREETLETVYSLRDKYPLFVPQ